MASPVVAIRSARAARIPVPDWRLEDIAGKPVLITRRFDRAGNQRIPFLSTMSMLGALDNEVRSYLEIADGLRQHGAAPAGDLVLLWKRIVFNVLISNSDDHLRNHGFLYAGNAGWRLSPAYDLNPVPVDIRPRVLSTAIDADDPTASMELACSVAEMFALKPSEARAVAREIAVAVSRWRETAAQIGLEKRDIDRMASAFDHADAASALKAV